MNILSIFYLLFYLSLVFGCNVMPVHDKAEERMGLLLEILKSGRIMNDWTNILCSGKFSDTLYKSLQEIPSTFAITSVDEENFEIEDVVPYAPHTILIHCPDFEDFEAIFRNTITSPYWHPLSNVIILFENNITRDMIGKIFFILWYYRASNAIIVQFNDSAEVLHVHNYSPYISENYELQNSFGCWTAKIIGMPLSDFKEGFVCVEGCHNVSSTSVLRANSFGTCIGYDSHKIPYNDRDALQKLVFFEDRGKNLRGFSMRTYGAEVKPFLLIDAHDNGTYSLHSRDGTFWATVAKAMNFSIDLSPSADVVKKPFHFERSIEQIYGFAQRKADLFLSPIYQFDLIIVEVDYTFPVKESGLCLMSHRAGFETTLFDVKTLKKNYDLFIEFIFCFLCMWFIFFIFHMKENNQISCDQAGKDLVNVFRSILSLSLYKAPKSNTFRLYLATSIWCFFLLNFFTQAATISFFSSFRRGKEVNTFDDVIEKGYIIEGLASPDAMLPDDDERFNKLNSKFVAINDWYECASRMLNDSHRFCLLDCAVGRYLERNLLNDNGEQYLYVAEQDRFHSLYLNMLLWKHSALTKHYNKIVQHLVEAGLVKKWEQYRYNDIKEEAQMKALGMEDLLGVFKCYGLLVAVCLCVFVGEIAPGLIWRITRFCKIKYCQWKRTRLARKKIRIEKKMGKIIHVNSSTQTN